jgi:RNA 2',3'-cyclic 3'-phosphodiesterase
MAEPLRTFVAVEVGPLPGIVSLIEGLRKTGADLKFVEPENLHVTVKFIGPTPADAVPRIEAFVKDAVADVPPFDAPLEGVASFGPKKSPRVVHVPLKDEEGHLAKAAGRLEAALADADLAKKESRAFKAHVTFARSRSPAGGRAVADFVKAHEHAYAGTVRVDALRLMRSQLSPTGPTYSELARVPFGGR